MSNTDLTDAKETIQMLSALWRLAKLSVTVKAHIIDNHLMDFLKRFRGLGQYDEEFMEGGHQDGMRNERRSANVKIYAGKAKLHSLWDRLGGNPYVFDVVKEYNSTRTKRARRAVNSIGNKAEQEEKRTKVKNERKNLII